MKVTTWKTPLGDSFLIRGINDGLEMTAEFFNMEFLEGQMQGEDLYNQVSAVIREWSYLGVHVPITKDGPPNITGNTVGLLNWQDTTNSRLLMHWQQKGVNHIVPTEAERELFCCGIKLMHLENNLYNEPFIFKLCFLLKANSFHVMVFMSFILVFSVKF